MKTKLDKFDPKTLEYQCTGCNHLCKLLLDRFIKPEDIIKCKELKARLDDGD